MKSILVLLAAAACLTVLALAQSAPTEGSGVGSANTSNAAGSPAPDAGAPSLNGKSAAPSANSVPLPGQPAGPSLDNNLPLIPDPVPGGHKGGHSHNPGGKAGAHARSSGTPKDTFHVEQDIRIRIRLREAENKVGNEPAIQAEWIAAHKTRTDPDRRAALTTYYTHFYDRVAKVDPALAERANNRKLAAISRMHYGRLGDLDYGQLIDSAYDPYATPTPPSQGKNPPAQDAPVPP